ncbi:MAG: putative toxin-antitoxin system toxin component, PIN family [Terracidiphilus sp.]|jgi:putative PIN family toxin of toxin-antitoxin system
MAGLRVVLDTKVLVSALAYPVSIPGRILDACREGELDLVLSRYILDEMVRILPRLPRIKLTPAEIRDLADSFLFLAEIVEPGTESDESLRDPADQLVLGTLRAAQADYLITGDKDLLALGERYPIVTPAIFWERHGR